MERWIFFGVFLIVETLVFAFVWVIRYHVRMFALPNDPRAKWLMFLMTAGAILLFFAAGSVLAIIIR